MDEVRVAMTHRVVEDAVHHLGVWRTIVDAAIQDLADRVDTRGRGEGRPEVLANVFDCVNSKAIDPVHAEDMARADEKVRKSALPSQLARGGI